MARIAGIMRIGLIRSLFFKEMLLNIIKKINAMQFSKYLVAGTASLALDFFAFYFVLHIFDWSIINANILGMVTGFISGFLLYHYWVFVNNKFALVTFLYMTFLFVINIFLVSYLIFILIDDLGLPVELAKIILQIGMVAWNFFIYKFIIFKRDNYER